MVDENRVPDGGPPALDVMAALSSRYTWVVLGALATLLVGWLVVNHPQEGPVIGGVAIGAELYYLQWIVYAAIIALLGTRLAQYRRDRTPRQDVGFVFLVATLYLIGFLLHYTPFVYEFPEPPLAGVVRAGVMIGCGVLGAMYGLSSKHRWR
jgi:FtsH-binding integral membrane protein